MATMDRKQGAPKVVVPKKDVKILMLHGYTQSGPSFRSKTRALEKLLQKQLAPHNLTPVLVYPTAPIRLLPRDIPGYQPQTTEGAGSDDTTPETTDAWAWWRFDEASDTYRFFDEGMRSLAGPIAAAGGIDGVLGFSQGGALAALLAAALEQPPRVSTSLSPSPPSPPSSSSEPPDWVDAVRSANGQRGLRFAVIYSGFYTPPHHVAWLLEPAIHTPTLHYIGSLDTVVDESRSQALVDRCTDAAVVIHPGGHFVPVSKQWIMPLVGFIKDHTPEPEPVKAKA